VSSHHEDSKKEKQRKKNRKLWEMSLNIERLNNNVDIAAPESERSPDGIHEKKDAASHSERLSSLRNRINYSREKSNTNWDVYATSGGGGRGR